MPPASTCSGPVRLSRRQVLQAGGISLLGLSLPQLPSEYMKRNVWATFQFETSNVDFTRQSFGADRDAGGMDVERRHRVGRRVEELHRAVGPP